MTLPTDYQTYVYIHKDPETENVIYVGSGTKDRAWHFRVSMSRSKEHTSYLNKLSAQGYIPSDWVEIISRNLSKGDGKKLEIELIERYNPIFNKNHKGAGKSVKNPNLIKEAKDLKNKGIVGIAAAEILGISIMTTWRYQNVY